MLLHIGNDICVNTKYIVGIFDLERTSVSRLTRDFLNNAVKKGKKVIYCTEEMPKSFIVTLDDELTECIYISQLACPTLLKRYEKGYGQED